LPTALAMVLGESVYNIVKEIGHDGSEDIEFSARQKKKKGFHIQELVKICYKRNKALIHFDRHVNIHYSMGVTIQFSDDIDYIYELMKDNKGLLLGQTKDNKDHAVAWDGEAIYDPNGTIYAKGFFVVETFLLIKDMK
jgi:hypothetical protein